ncbi:MAG: hypothetical protein UE068_05195 [Paludibacteraceae bacterium]|nr:hypothetical protein [Paludibacteraceae bacterium]
MKLSIQEGNLTVSKEFTATEYQCIAAEEVVIGAYDIISRIYGQKAVIRAYHRTCPDRMDVRPEEE